MEANSPVGNNPTRPSMTKRSSNSSSHSSPIRQHKRTISSSIPVKETQNAHSEYQGNPGDGTSQLRINQYLIQKEIGRGSFGAVHLATDQYGKEYAVKEFSKTRLRRRAKSNMLRQARQRSNQQSGGMPSPKDLIPSFGRAQHQRPAPEEKDNSFDLIREEIAVMKKLNHQNLVSLIEVLDDPEEDSLYMVLEMCKKGVVMRIEVDESVKPYDEESCRCWFRDLVLAIEYLHAQGVVHRDIKPDNCLLTEDDMLKVVDFGVSEMFEKHSDMRIAKSAGSPAFMAPELCTVGHGDVSGVSSDIWSMGVTLFCLVFGRVPFQKVAFLDLYSSIVNDPITLDEDCGPDLSDLMLRILEKDPDKRITMSELREHPWVTANGTDPLLSSEENCSNLVTPPTEEEKNAAITSNMSRLVIVMRAVNRFKALLERKRPDLFERGIISRISSNVHPPTIIGRATKDPQRQPSSSADEETTGRNSEPYSSDSRALSSDGQQIDSVHRGSDQENTPRDPYDERLFLHIGDPETNEDAVSSSPPPVDYNVFAKAYEDEVQRIQRQNGQNVKIYKTRRIDGSNGIVGSAGQQLKGLASLVMGKKGAK